MIDREVNSDVNASIEILIGRVLNKLAKDEMSDDEAKSKSMDVTEYGMTLFLECLLRAGPVKVFEQLDASSLPLLFPMMHGYFTSPPSPKAYSILNSSKDISGRSSQTKQGKQTPAKNRSGRKRRFIAEAKSQRKENSRNRRNKVSNDVSREPEPEERKVSMDMRESNLQPEESQLAY